MTTISQGHLAARGRAGRASRGHPLLGAVAGLVFGISADAALLAFTVLALNSVLLIVVPIATLVLGTLWGFWAPFGKSAASRSAGNPAHF